MKAVVGRALSGLNRWAQGSSRDHFPCTSIGTGIGPTLIDQSGMSCTHADPVMHYPDISDVTSRGTRNFVNAILESPTP